MRPIIIEGAGYVGKAGVVMYRMKCGRMVPEEKFFHVTAKA